MTTDQEKVAARISALLQKTTINGCTEAETLAAAELAAKLQIQYNMALSDIEIMADPLLEYSFDRADDLAFMPEDYCVEGIEKLCGVKIWYTKRDEKALFTNDIHKVRLLSILGVESDVKFAHWLYIMIGNSVDAAFKVFSNTVIYKRSPAPLDGATSFKIGMATRINARLKELAGNAETGQTTTGTDLVVIKAEKLKAALKKRNYTFNTVVAKDNLTDANARQQGHAAGDDVNLSRPVEGRRPRVRLNG